MNPKDPKAEDQLDFSKGNGLLPVIIQDAETREVLMQAYMNRDALEKTIQTGLATFYSRSKQRLWTKGESSGHFLQVLEIRGDCDMDCLIIKVKPAGPACHTGATSCFFNTITKHSNNLEEMKEESKSDLSFIVYLEELLRSRRAGDPEKSYTARLFSEGSKRIAKKLGEEAVELALEAEHGDRERFTEEAADLVYHLTVLLLSKGLGWSEVVAELKKRHGK